jgi:alkane 1-monooxygenase
MSPWKFLRFLFLPALVIAASLLSGWWNFLVPTICFIIHPVVSLLSKQKRELDLENEELETSYSSKLYRAIPFLFVPVLIGTTAWSIASSRHDSLREFVGLALSLGIVNGILGFTLAHEFIHRPGWLEKTAGQVLLIQNNYPHYAIEHISGHHLYACTSKDQHSARIGESFYEFLPRAIWLTLANSLEIESRRLVRKKYRAVGVHNRVLTFLLSQLAVYVMIVFLAGWSSLVFFILQGFVSILLLNVTGYLQHYGLSRKEVAGGFYERISAHHAWSSQKSKDGLNLFQVDRHADHHMHPSHTYEKLVHHDDSPQQPASYSAMIWLALVPPLWFRVMNKRVLPFTNKTFHHETA